MELKGIGASPGIAIGKALVIKNEEIKIDKKTNVDIQAEIKKLRDAIVLSKRELEQIKNKVAHEVGEEEAEIFGAHLLVLEDPELIGETENKIKNETVNADFALNETKEMFVSIFESMDNEYMRERATDIKDVTNRVIRHILGIKVVDLSSLDEEVILVAHDLTPSDTASMDKEKVQGFLTDIGGRTSHTAIMSRTLEIPAIVGIDNATTSIKDGDILVFDGDNGVLIVNPEKSIINEYKEKKKVFEADKLELEKLIGQESLTADGRKVELAGNIGTPNDLEGLINNDAEGVGLYRTEFLYMDSDKFPDEETQYQAYKKVLEGMKDKPVVIRTLDIGGDKKLSYFHMDEEMNPFLGYRAIRLCLDKTEIFKTQLRALFRASVHGKLRIMFPMISSLEELLKAKDICEEVKEELSSESILYSKDVEIGMMIEVPSAAIISDILAKHVDFFSIGTNDLVQYTCAVDRMNQKISYLYNQFNPAVLRLINLVINNAHQEGKWVGMCGESAGDEKMIPILLGFGLDEFSMSPISILRARRLIKSLNEEDMIELAEEVLDLESAEEVEKYMDDFIASRK
ncbi:phosphoenolpyruvate--protein phosphotransferase [Peptostreptococcus equinus]|uniref:Phosphoenolpyruvate-protein phosphotransferase n=1 Tax=Peptostreptococcus equinus TaxID=3003601 RepID=A0ABY7JUH7_9FIRM|nr:phosphoenolpyruvate--protein phosphotransferase [Peptostreptococcus sp. CBA3647]WAW15557.1 phosphoenolpyruvate--protein phosphotransferase [Peptostreptococcus sp. CBA3647]